MRPEIESKLSELKFSLANLDHAGTRADVKKAQSILEELRALLAPAPELLEVFGDEFGVGESDTWDAAIAKAKGGAA